jgi:hypothetical protein
VERERSAAAAMLGLPGFVVLAVSEVDGELEQAIETTVDLVGCPECGAVAQLQALLHLAKPRQQRPFSRPAHPFRRSPPASRRRSDSDDPTSPAGGANRSTSWDGTPHGLTANHTRPSSGYRNAPPPRPPDPTSPPRPATPAPTRQPHPADSADPSNSQTDQRTTPAGNLTAMISQKRAHTASRNQMPNQSTSIHQIRITVTNTLHPVIIPAGQPHPC